MLLKNGMSLVTVDGIIKVVGRRLAEALGYDRSDITELPLANLVHPAEGRHPSEADTTSAPKEDSTYRTLALRHRDQSPVWFHVETGSLESVRPGAALHDLTPANRDNPEASFSEGSEFLYSLLDSLESPVFYKDADAKYRECNVAFANNIVGLPRAEILGRTVLEAGDRIPPELGKIYYQHDLELLRSGGRQIYTADVLCADDVVRKFQLTKSVVRGHDGTVLGLVGVMVDISDLVRMEQQARETEQKFRRLFSSVLNGIAVTDRNDVVTMCNPALARILGEDAPEDIVGRSILDYLSGPSGELIEAETQKRKQGLSSEYEIELTDRKGQQKWIWVYITPNLDDRGNYMGAYGAVLDVTRSKLLQKRQSMLVTAIEAAAEVVVVTDDRGIIRYANAAYVRESGYGLDEVIGQPASINKSGEHSEEFYAELWETITRGQTWKGRLTNRRKDGTLYHEDCTISPVVDDNGEIVQYVAVKRNVSRELHLEEQLHRSQRLEAVGLLAGGIAHDFNNILTAILGYAELLRVSLAGDEAVDNDLLQIVKSARRASDLTSQLLAFSRRSKSNPNRTDINECIGSLSTMLKRLVGEHCRITLQLSPEPSWVMIDETQLEQVIVNLVINARDAMEAGGNITLRTSRLEKPLDLAHQSQTAEYVAMECTDTGMGMEKDVIEQIFDPFFTTKEIGKGTGLGLSTVFGIVESANGRIEVDSTPGKGTRFTILLPELTEDVSCGEEIGGESVIGD